MQAWSPTPEALPLPAMPLGLRVANWLGRKPFAWRWRVAGWLALLHLRGDPTFRELVVTNVSLCFPDWSMESKLALIHSYAQEHFFALLDRARCWSLPEVELRQQVELAGAEHLHQHLRQGPVVLLCPHFLGLEAAAQRLALEGSMMTLYRPSARQAFDSHRRHARQRFNAQHLVPVGAPLLPLVRRLQSGTPLFLLPDLDVGKEGALFVPFFGIQASTARIAAWCALRAGAQILPMAVQHMGQGRYTARIDPPLPPLPQNMGAATLELNRVVEQLVRECPAQYWWAQARFATRPKGQTPLYSVQLLNRLQQAAGPGKSR